VSARQPLYVNRKMGGVRLSPDNSNIVQVASRHLNNKGRMRWPR